MFNTNKVRATKRKAFTLIELLIVIAIIGILFIVLVSKVDFATDKAKASGVQTDFRAFQMAFDTVAKENAGFNTFGWDTGDLNQDGIRNSYDEGDNGAGGGTANNGIQDGTEVFTGHKVYTETFTKVYSLKKNGTGAYDRDALNRLETAINANLDPKLHITIADDGKITMANGAQDPWNKEYHGYYITNAEADGKDRGAIVMYSDGANNEFGSEHTIANGIVSISIPGSNKDGKDDYAVVSVYTYLNGYGEVKNITSGFSNNQNLGVNNQPSTPIVPGGGSNNEEVPDTPEQDNGEKVAFFNKYLANPGCHSSALSHTNSCYIEEENSLTWEELKDTANGQKYGYFANKISDTKISTNAFTDCHSLVSITIPDTVTTISSYAFQMSSIGLKSSLTHVSIPNSITSIESQTFSGTALTSIEIPSSVTYIGSSAFSKTNLTSVTIPDTVTSIGSSAFSSCTSLQNVVIGNGVKTIPSTAFAWCSNLTTVQLGPNVTNIDTQAFYECYRLTTINIPQGVTNIGNSAFYYCSNLISINVPNTVTNIGNQAFYGCYNLVEVFNYSSIPAIQGSTVNGYMGYYALIIDAPANPTSQVSIDSDGYVFYRYNNVYYLMGYIGTSTDLVLPTSYNGESYSVYKYAFYNYSSLTSIVIPSEVIKVDTYAFYGCSKLSIFCEAASKPASWDTRWNPSSCPVTWGYTN